MLSWYAIHAMRCYTMMLCYGAMLYMVLCYLHTTMVLATCVMMLWCYFLVGAMSYARMLYVCYVCLCMSSMYAYVYLAIHFYHVYLCISMSMYVYICLCMPMYVQYVTNQLIHSIVCMSIYVVASQLCPSCLSCLAVIPESCSMTVTFMCCLI